jgi:general secretion pathway protein H
MTRHTHPGDRLAQHKVVVRAAGFTLLELIVVVFIIGLIVSFAGLSLHQPRSRAAAEEAARLQALVRLASEEAVQNGWELALQIDRDGYGFARLDGDTWRPLADDRLLRARPLPPDIRVELRLEGVRVQLGDAEQPAQVLLLSSGEITPFEINLRGADGAAFVLRGALDGTLQLEQIASHG